MSGRKLLDPNTYQQGAYLPSLQSTRVLRPYLSADSVFQKFATGQHLYTTMKFADYKGVFLVGLCRFQYSTTPDKKYKVRLDHT